MGLVGTRLGKYELTAEIGHGGMSIVYRARDTQLQRDVAVKVMHAFLAEQPEARERFHREAVAVARLKHPNIIEIFDYSGEDASTSYIVMELIDGPPLADVVKNGPVGCPEAALILAHPIADALEHAHRGGVVHRDLKPENILLGRTGELKLTDFGIARILDNQAMTMTGTLLGSPAYMAPEYIEGYATDERADIFSFGTMLYFIMVGRLPFEAPSPHALLKRIASGEYPPPQQANPKIHAAIARLLARCLKRLPEQRFASAAELRDAIAVYLSGLKLDWESELPHLLEDPRAYSVQLENRSAARYTVLGKEALARGEHGAAMEHFDRVLCTEPNNVEVRRLLQRIGRRRSALRAVRVGAAVTLTCGVLLGSGLGAVRLVRERDDGRARRPAPATTLDPPAPPPAPQPPVGSVVGDEGRAKSENRGPSADSRTLTTEGRGPSAENRAPTADSRQPNADNRTPTTEPSSDATALTPEPRARPTEHRPVRFNAVNVVTAYVDDNPAPTVRDRVGPFTLDLTYGTHRLRFTNPLAYDNEMSLTVDATNPPQLVVVRLLPLPAKLFIDRAPDGATVEVGGRTWLVNAQTRNEPIFVALPLGSGSQSLEVVVRRGDLEYRKTVEFKPGQERRLDVQLDHL